MVEGVQGWDGGDMDGRRRGRVKQMDGGEVRMGVNWDGGRRRVIGEGWSVLGGGGGGGRERGDVRGRKVDTVDVARVDIRGGGKGLWCIYINK